MVFFLRLPTHPGLRFHRDQGGAWVLKAGCSGREAARAAQARAARRAVFVHRGRMGNPPGRVGLGLPGCQAAREDVAGARRLPCPRIRAGGLAHAYHRHRQPEGRLRKDHHHREPGRCPGRRRPPGAGGGPGSAGACHAGPGHRCGGPGAQPLRRAGRAPGKPRPGRPGRDPGGRRRGPAGGSVGDRALRPRAEARGRAQKTAPHGSPRPWPRWPSASTWRSSTAHRTWAC